MSDNGGGDREHWRHAPPPIGPRTDGPSNEESWDAKLIGAWRRISGKAGSREEPTRGQKIVGVIVALVIVAVAVDVFGGDDTSSTPTSGISGGGVEQPEPGAEDPEPKPEDLQLFADCDEALEASVSDIPEGDALYDTSLDEDGDGVACEDGGAGEDGPAPEPEPALKELGVSDRELADTTMEVLWSQQDAASRTQVCDAWNLGDRQLRTFMLDQFMRGATSSGEPLAVPEAVFRNAARRHFTQSC